MAGCLSVLPGLALSSITETRYCMIISCVRGRSSSTYLCNEHPDADPTPAPGFHPRSLSRHYPSSRCDAGLDLAPGPWTLPAVLARLLGWRGTSRARAGRGCWSALGQQVDRHPRVTRQL